MAKTAYTTSDNLTKKLWDEQLFRDQRKESYFNRFMANNQNALVHTKEQLTKSKGDNITFGIRMRLAGAGVTSGYTLEGNEEKLTTYDFNVSLEEYAHAVRDKGPLDRTRPMYNIDDESRNALQDWGAEKIDQLCFDAIVASPTRVFYRTSGGNLTTATAATAKAALTTANGKIDPTMIQFAKTWAKTGGNRTQTPLRPIRVNGKNYFVLLVHPDVNYDLKTNSTWTQANREARERSTENPIFSGADAIWDGVVVHEHENIPIAADAGSGSDVPWAKCVMMGAQSLVWADGMRPKLVGEEFDYGREHGFAWCMMCGVAKPVFNSKDYGSVAVYVARTQISDA